MSYVIAIKTAIIIFPIIAFLFTVPFMLYNYHKYGSIHPFKTIITYTFILYLITIYFLVILPLPSKEEALKITGPHFNFVPFSFVIEFLKETSLVITNPSTYLQAIKEPCFYVVIFNIFMTVPFGMYLHYYFKCSFKKTLVYTFFLSLFFEITQGTGLYFIYPNPYRLCDIDDLILNTTGGVLGYLIMSLFIKFLPTRDELDKKAREDGKRVSGLRRLTVFNLDIIIYLLISALFSFLTNKQEMFYYIFFFYYLVIPIYRKQTLAMRFLNVEMEYNRYYILKNILRNIFLALYYFYLPVGVFTFLNFSINTFGIEDIKVLIHLLGFTFILLFYLVNILYLLIKKKMYYDSIFGFKYHSTIITESETLLK